MSESEMESLPIRPQRPWYRNRNFWFWFGLALPFLLVGNLSLKTQLSFSIPWLNTALLRLSILALPFLLLWRAWWVKNAWLRAGTIVLGLLAILPVLGMQFGLLMAPELRVTAERQLAWSKYRVYEARTGAIGRDSIWLQHEQTIFPGLQVVTRLHYFEHLAPAEFFDLPSGEIRCSVGSKTNQPETFDFTAD